MRSLALTPHNGECMIFRRCGVCGYSYQWDERTCLPNSHHICKNGDHVVIPENPANYIIPSYFPKIITFKQEEDYSI